MGQLQWERAALEKAQARIKLRDEEVTQLSGELVQEGVSYEDLGQASEEKDAIILELQQAAATARATLESVKKQVEGELLFLPFICWLSLFGIRSQLGLHWGCLVSRTRPCKPPCVQGLVVWLPARTFEPGSPRANPSPRPGSLATPKSTFSAGPGWLGAAVSLLMTVLVYD
jgi:hypothetical protein